MDCINNSIKIIDHILINNLLLPIIIAIFCFIKCIIIIFLLKNRSQNKRFYHLSLFLIIFLIGTLFEDLAWVTHFYFRAIDHSQSKTLYLIIRIAWLLSIVRFHSLCLFLEKLAGLNNKTRTSQKILLFISSIIISFLLLALMVNVNVYSRSDLWTSEQVLIRLIPLYLQFIVMSETFLFLYRHFKNNEQPRIVKLQLKIVFTSWIIPTYIMDIIQNFPFDLSILSTTWITNNYIFVGLSNALLTYMAFYCARNLLRLRFLDLKNHVQSARPFKFMDNFKDVLEQLSQATSMQELQFITQSSFQKAFAIPSRSLTLATWDNANNKLQCQFQPALVNTLLLHNSPILKSLKQSKILIYDEISFDNLCNQTEQSEQLLKLLEAIHADIILPIFNQDKLVGYIIIDRNARPKNLYGHIERDEMIVFASYLGNIIHLLQSRCLDQLLMQEKELKEELYRKHQEINQYKESIRSFIRNNKQRKIGIIFYKKNRFVFANREASELITFNLNTHDGHKITQACKKIAKDVETYKSPKYSFTTDDQNIRLVVAGLPSAEKNHVILLAYYPEISDIIAPQIDQLHDPSLWDYLLYLETTASGKLINQLLPSNSEQFLRLKIDLLKIALSTKATLLSLPDDDLMPVVELFHHISLRSTIHILTLEHHSVNNELCISLFGVNPLLDSTSISQALIKKHDGGTLFIKNIHLLDIESQIHLAEFIRYGFFKPFKSDQKIASNARIICSTNQDLQAMVNQGTFCKDLFIELQKTIIQFPCLLTLSDYEIHELSQGFAHQIIANPTYKSLLEFSEKDHNIVSKKRPASIQELKSLIANIMLQKSKHHQINSATTFDPGFALSDPQLIEIARLGKYALRDASVMACLWNKFKNQNKIATFLGVNRSSVNRRCQQYKLE